MSARARHPRWAAVEVCLAAVVILADLAIPTLVVLALLAASLLIRRRGFATLGFHRLSTPWRTASEVLALTVLWTLMEFGLVMPLLNRATGTRQDMGAFEDLEGNVPLLLALLVASWTLAALAEETVFRGYLPTRVLEAVGNSRGGVWASVLLPAVLFSAIHLEQGRVGVVLTFLDALFLMWLRRRYASVWASVLGHGFSNSIGLLTFFVVGPVYGLW